MYLLFSFKSHIFYNFAQLVLLQATQMDFSQHFSL